MTPLHHAAWSKVADTTRLLLQNGASVNPQDVLRETPLLIAARSGQDDVVAALLEFGGDPCLKNVRDESPLDVAAQVLAPPPPPLIPPKTDSSTYHMHTRTCSRHRQSFNMPPPAADHVFFP